jgi:uncharacterized YigZ family protein
LEKDEYHSISISGRSLYKEKGSKFIGIAVHVDNDSEFKSALEELKKEFHDARHICFAFSHGLNPSTIGKNDDGEPTHSAGNPILGQITAHDLSNSAIFVVRYFGGTKLGVGGLKQAYKIAADQAVKNSKTGKYFICKKLKLIYEYPQTPEIQKLISDFEIKILEQEYSEKCFLNVEVRLSKIDAFLKKLDELEYLNVTYDLD